MKVLIIEDEALLVMDMEAAVEDAGGQLFADVSSVYELQALDSDVAPDLAFVDINLAKGTSGLDASIIVRERWTNAFIVFVTANPGKIPDSHAGSHGVITSPARLA